MEVPKKEYLADLRYNKKYTLKMVAALHGVSIWSAAHWYRKYKLKYRKKRKPPKKKRIKIVKPVKFKKVLIGTMINCCLLVKMVEPYHFPTGKRYHPKAEFICPHCGKKFIARADKVKSAWTRSCGCISSKITSELHKNNKYAKKNSKIKAAR